MESYKNFLERTNSFEKEDIYFGDGFFSANPSLSLKVTSEGKFKNFYGDTVVFNLDVPTKKRLTEITDTLYKNSPECFCEAIFSETFHMTLHDLSNSSLLDSIAEEIFFNSLKVSEIFRKIKKEKIHMKTKYIFNMVNTSLVIGLYPTDEDEYNKLMSLYLMFDEVKALSYPLTPHITLAYFNPDGFGAESAQRLSDTVLQLNKNNFEIELDTLQLFYQKFTGMNSYVNIMGLSSVQNNNSVG